MGIPDFWDYDDDPESEEGKRSDDEFNKYKDMLKDDSSGITSTEALEELVTYCFEKEKYEDALHFVDRLLDLVPYSVDAWQRKGLILNNLFKHEDALACFDKALSINPVDPELLCNKGITLDDLGRNEEALQCFERALEVDPSNDDALFNKGITLEKIGRFDEAVSIFKFVLEGKPSHRDAWYELGYCYDYLDKATSI
jgi:tetratricopeptide (TPR) repeat protein